MKQKRKQAKWHGRRKWPTHRGSKRSLLPCIHDQCKKSVTATEQLFPISSQPHPETRWQVQRHLQNSSRHHAKHFSTARHGEKESHPAHSRPVQDRPERQSTLAGAGAAAHTRPVSMKNISDQDRQCVISFSPPFAAVTITSNT